MNNKYIDEIQDKLAVLTDIALKRGELIMLLLDFMKSDGIIEHIPEKLIDKIGVVEKELSILGNKL